MTIILSPIGFVSTQISDKWIAKCDLREYESSYSKLHRVTTRSTIYISAPVGYNQMHPHDSSGVIHEKAGLAKKRNSSY